MNYTQEFRFGEATIPRTSKRFIQSVWEEGQCEYCGFPLYIDDRLYFELENHEEFMFCSRSCAHDYDNTIRVKTRESR